MADTALVTSLIVAALGGAGIGVERERSGHATGANARFAGVRTFTMLGGAAGVAGWLARSGHAGLAIVLVSGLLAITVSAYIAASRRDVDATTEVAACVAIAAGLLAGLGSTMLASGIIAITVLLLVEKSELHALVARLDGEELRAAARFAVMAVVVLPLLPDGPYGPLGGVRPRMLWLLVLFFTGLSFTGYFARRILGASHGYPLTGALAGLVSSTSATFTFARLSRDTRLPAATLATGAVAACTMLFPRVLVATAVLEPRVALALLPLIAIPFALGAGLLAWWLRSDRDAESGQPVQTNPLQVWPALQMAVTFQLVLFGVHIVRTAFGDAGLLATGAVLGLADIDALTIGMARSAAAGTPVDTAAQAITIGILANCVMKGSIALVLGARGFSRRTAGAMAGMAAALAVMLWVVR